MLQKNSLETGRTVGRNYGLSGKFHLRTSSHATAAASLTGLRVEIAIRGIKRMENKKY